MHSRTKKRGHEIEVKESDKTPIDGADNNEDKR